MLGHAKNSYFKNFFVILYKIKLVAYHAGRMYTNRWQNMNAMFAQITFQWCLWHTLVMNLQGKGIKTCHIDEKKRTILLLYHKCNSFFPTYMINIQRLIKHCTQFDYYIHWYIYSLRKLKLKSCSLRSLFSPLFFWGGGEGVVLCTGSIGGRSWAGALPISPVGPGVCSSPAAVLRVAKYCQTLANVSKHLYINER